MKAFINQLTLQQRKALFEATKGAFFTCTFRKKDGTLRKMVARTGVKKGLTGTGRTWEKENLVTVWDIEAKGYRHINLETLSSIRCGKRVEGV